MCKGERLKKYFPHVLEEIKLYNAYDLFAKYESFL